MPDLQILVHPKNQTARKAERFFKERGVPYHRVDLRKKAPTAGELKKWVRRFGVEQVVDPGSKTYQDKGLRYLSASDDDWIDRMVANPDILNLPLVRCGRDLAVGDDPESWERFAEAVKEA